MAHAWQLVLGSGSQTLATVAHLVLALDVALARAEAHRGTVARSPEHHLFTPRGTLGDRRVAARDQRVPAGRWTHLALVHDGGWGHVRLHVDGVEVAREVLPGRPRLERERSLRVGTWHQANQAFRGTIDELLVYGRALGTREIAVAAAQARR